MRHLCIIACIIKFSTLPLDVYGYFSLVLQIVARGTSVGVNNNRSCIVIDYYLLFSFFT